MKKYIVFLCVIATSNLFAQTQRIELNQNWTFKKEQDTKWLPAAVPGTVHTDLMQNKLIPDPFFGTNEKDVQWVENENWEYQTQFTATKEMLANQNIELVFKGLDTYAEIELNNQKIASTDNMFREWRYDVKKLLKEGDNILKIKFLSPYKTALPVFDKIPYALPADNDRGEKHTSVVTRKAPYQFGWDWGPRLLTSGIWKPVYLELSNTAKIRNVQIVQKSLTKEKAELEIRTTFESFDSKTIFLKVSYQPKDYVSIQDLRIMPLTLKKGIQTYISAVTINNPKLWWCNGLGDAQLYDITVYLTSTDHLTLDSLEEHIGLRTIEVVQEPDSVGKSFYFKVNGVPVFMKGANTIPFDNFLPRVTKDVYKNYIQQAAQSNINMLRVWGGGIYEDDEFYNQCDENGILVWQDFMFACSFYPGDTAFLNNVKAEAEQNIIRLRNHPSLALWCGNNEIDEAWHNWGYQAANKYSVKDSTEIWENYKALFHKLLPEVIAQNDSRFYWASSPQFGWGRPQSLKQGDSHYWGIWWGDSAFSTYKNKVGRFMSEYGFQAFPDKQTFKQYMPDFDRAFSSPTAQTHQKNWKGYPTIKKYMGWEYKIPEKLDDYIYTSQILQAYGIKTAIEAHRKAMPYCMGSLYWQFNDCWPVISWSGIDYTGRWKALQYFVKKAFASDLIVIDTTDKNTDIWIVSDKLQDEKATLTVRLMDFSGKTLYKKSTKINKKGNTSARYFTFNHKDIAFDPAQCVLQVELLDKKGVIADNVHYYRSPKDLKFTQPAIEKSIKVVADGFEIRLKAHTLVKNLYLFLPENVDFSDNYFDLLPNQERIIKCKNVTNINALEIQYLN